MNDLSSVDPYMLERLSKLKEYYMKQMKEKAVQKAMEKAKENASQDEIQVTNENDFANPNESSPPTTRTPAQTIVQKPQ